MMEMKSAGMKTTDRKMTEPTIAGGLAEISVKRVTSEMVSFYVGSEKLMDILISADEKIAVHKRHRGQPICVNAKDLLIKMINVIS